jgi:hypothetical protein
VALRSVAGDRAWALYGAVVTTNFAVGNETDLNHAIQSIDAAAAGSGAYTIDVAGTINLTSDLLPINLPSGVSVTVEGTTGGCGPERTVSTAAEPLATPFE